MEKIKIEGVYKLRISDKYNNIRVYTGWLDPFYNDQFYHQHGREFSAFIDYNTNTTKLNLTNWRHGEILNHRTITALDRAIEPSELEGVLIEAGLLETALLAQIERIILEDVYGVAEDEPEMKTVYDAWDDYGFLITENPETGEVFFEIDSDVCPVHRSILDRLDDIVWDDNKGWCYSNGDDLPWIDEPVASEQDEPKQKCGRKL